MIGELLPGINALLGVVVGGAIGIAGTWYVGKKARQAERQERVLLELGEVAIEVQQLLWMANQRRELIQGEGFRFVQTSQDDVNRILPVIRRLRLLARLPEGQAVREKGGRAADLANKAWSATESHLAAQDVADTAIMELMDAVGDAFRELG